MKHINYFTLEKFSTNVLNRMLRCDSYYSSLDSDTICSIYGILYDRYEVYLRG